jgi:hypothetical protein
VATKTGEGEGSAFEVTKSEFRRWKWIDQPSFAAGGRDLGFLFDQPACRNRNGRDEGFRMELAGPLFKSDAVIRRQGFESLDKPARPADRGLNAPFASAQTKKQLLGMLRKKARPRLEQFDLAAPRAFYAHYRSDRVAIALLAPQPEAHRIASTLHHVAEDAELRPRAILKNHLQAAIMVEIRQSEGTGIIPEIQTHGA